MDADDVGVRIVYINQYFATPAMASGTRSFEFARRLADRGHEVHVVTSGRPPAAAGPRRHGRWTVTQEAGAWVHWCDLEYSNAMSYPDRIRAFLEFGVRATARVCRLRCDVVFGTSTPLTVAVPAVIGARRHRVPMVFEVRDLWPTVPIALGALRRPVLRKLAYALEGWTYRHAEHVIALSPDMRRDIVTRFPRVTCSVIPNSSDRDLFAVGRQEAERFRAARPWLGGRPLIVYAGTFGLVNGLSYLVRMAAAMRTTNEEVAFLLVGGGREEAGLRELAEELGVLGVNLYLEPAIPKAEVPALLAAASLCVSTVIDVPELRANSANKVFDAFAASRPVMINHEGWLADLLRGTGAGHVVPADDPVEAARSTAALLADPDWSERSRRAAQELGEEDFSRDRLFIRFEEILRQAARRPGERAPRRTRTAPQPGRS